MFNDDMTTHPECIDTYLSPTTHVNFPSEWYRGSTYAEATLQAWPLPKNAAIIEHMLTFIDLFAGIGGFHIAFTELGAKCVFASEWDKVARDTYQSNYQAGNPGLFTGKNFAGDITKVASVDIPNHNIMCGGFPCQAFSNAGRKLGFQDVRGTMFFEVARILKDKQPDAFFLENVRGLLNHDEGRTFTTIRNTIQDLGYSFHYKIVHAKDHGTPQNRPRVFMVGFKNAATPFEFPEATPLKITLEEIFGGKTNREIAYTLRVGGRSSGLNDRRNWDTYLVDGQPHKLTVQEGLQLQGFPTTFLMPTSETAAMKLLGNSVAVPAIQAVAKNIVDALELSQKGATRKK